MNFDKIIMNPPYDNGLGGKITFEVISLLKDNKDCICLMPLSNYKNKSAELWRYVKTFELADPKLFVDAKITDNLCICTLSNKFVDIYKCYEGMEETSWDSKYRLFYEYNKNHKKFGWSTWYNKGYTNLNISTDFVELSRLSDSKGGSGYGTGGCGYKWNVLKDGYQDNWAASLVVLNFETSKQKDNFAKWWYQGSKGKSFSSKVNLGLNSSTPSPFAIPQIDWETISDNPLWKEGKYDEAVLDVMDLMWDENKSNIVRKKNEL